MSAVAERPLIRHRQVDTLGMCNDPTLLGALSCNAVRWGKKAKAARDDGWGSDGGPNGVFKG
jgi:hypothetical protein